MAPVNSIFGSDPDSERLWIDKINEILREEFNIDIDLPVSIFRVPAVLSAFNPKAYVPQLIGLGPYHHFRPELYEMERYKLAAVSRVQKLFQSLEFRDLVGQLKMLEHTVRGCYHKHLDMQGEKLAWIMAIDGLFLLILLDHHKNRDGRPSSPAAASLGDAGKRLGNVATLSDVLMLENQIPMVILREIFSWFSIQRPSAGTGNNSWPSMLKDFCEAVSPLKLLADPPSQVPEFAHLLDVLYRWTVPKLEGQNQSSNGSGENGGSSSNSANFDRVFTRLWSFACGLSGGTLRNIADRIMEILHLARTAVTNEAEDVITQSGSTSAAVVEEIMIPSVSLLCAFGVEFSPTAGDITTIRFDPREKRFHLPVITLNIHSEVIMRNLVAYEACVSESLVFARYTELMNGIIDTAEDAKLLRERKIIVNSLKSDADVAELFNGMSKAVRLTKVPYMDRAIEDVNNYFNNTRRVRAYACMKKCGYGFCKVLTVLAVILFMLLSCLESFCSVFGCPGLFHTIGSDSSKNLPSSLLNAVM